MWLRNPAKIVRRIFEEDTLQQMGYRALLTGCLRMEYNIVFQTITNIIMCTVRTMDKLHQWGNFFDTCGVEPK